MTVPLPPPDRGGIAVPDRSAQHIVGKPVDLQAHDPRHVGLLRVLATQPLGALAHAAAVVEVDVVEAEDGCYDGVDHRDSEGKEHAVEHSAHHEFTHPSGPPNTDN